MVGKVQLSFDQRQGLYALQQIERSSTRSQRRLLTQQRLHSPVDGISDYFLAEQLGESLDILRARKNEIGQGVSALSTTVSGLESAQDFLRIAKAIALEAQATLASDGSLQDVAGELRQDTQTFLSAFNNFILAVQNTEYSDLNLTTSTEQRLLVRYSEDRDQQLLVSGRNLFGLDTNVEQGGIFSANDNNGERTGVAAAVFSLINNRLVFSNFVNVREQLPLQTPPVYFSFNGFSSLRDFEALHGGRADEVIEEIGQNIDRALNRLEAHEEYFANNLAILQTRAVFNRNLTRTLGDGRRELTAVDTNEEAVIVSALQTRNGLALSSLSLLGERHQQLLRLLQ